VGEGGAAVLVAVPVEVLAAVLVAVLAAGGVGLDVGVRVDDVDMIGGEMGVMAGIGVMAGMGVIGGLTRTLLTLGRTPAPVAKGRTAVLEAVAGTGGVVTALVVVGGTAVLVGALVVAGSTGVWVGVAVDVVTGVLVAADDATVTVLVAVLVGAVVRVAVGVGVGPAVVKQNRRWPIWATTAGWTEVRPVLVSVASKTLR
jgi:hypothetical protein